MPARLVREEAPERPLRLVPPLDRETPRPPQTSVSREAVLIEAAGLLTALSSVLSVRLVLLLATIFAAALSAYAVQQHTIVSVAAAAVFDALVLIPVVGLTVSKG